MRPPDVRIQQRTLAGEIGVAQALYDNVAEWPDELAFERGDILRVLDERPGANGDQSRPGWWYCVNADGQRGVVPSNRLRMMHRFDNNIQQRVITPQRFGDLFMFDDNGRLPPFGGFDGPFLKGTSFMSESLPPFSFDSGSVFERLFPLPPLEHFDASTPLRAMPSRDAAAASSSRVVRNIPIKIETAGGDKESRAEHDSRGFAVPGFSQGQRHSSAPPPFFSTPSKKLTSVDRVSPPPPPQRRYFNTIVGANPSSSSSVSSSSSDEEHKRPRAHKNLMSIPITVAASTASMKRPTLAAKPNLSNLFGRQRVKKETLDPDYDKPIRDADDVAHVAWRLTKLATPLKNGNDSASREVTSTKQEEGALLGNVSSNDFGTASMHVNTTLASDVASSSPSSSGIVADINDSNGEANQRASAASSLSTESTSEQCSEHNEPAYDVPQTRGELSSAYGRRGRGEVQSPSLQPQVPLKNTPLQPQSQLAQLRHSSDSYGSPADPKFDYSSTSVLQNVFNGLKADKLRTADESDLRANVTFNPENRSMDSSRSDRSPSTVAVNSFGGVRGMSEDRPRRGAGTLPDIAARYRAAESNSEFNEDDPSSRKRAVCTKLSENYRLVDLGVKKMQQCTAPRAWRQPHVLQQRLIDIKETVESITAAINNFLDAANRIAVDINNPKSADLKQLLTPLRKSRCLILELKESIEHTGWTLAALSRPRTSDGTTPGNDALDQFLAVIKQMPSDCYKVVQLALTFTPSSSIRFLCSPPKDSLSEFSNLYQPQNGELLRMSGIDSTSEDSKRLSTASTISSATATSSSDFQMLPVSSRSATDTLVSSHNGTASRFATPKPTSFSDRANRASFSESNPYSSRFNGSLSESRVMEEDDLESVVSDRDSLYQDYALAGEDGNGSVRRRSLTSLPPTHRLSVEIINSLSEDDRQLLRFYSPQLDAHTQFLSKAIEDFLSVVEEQFPPREFVQKGKLIILAAHKLIYIGDNIAQCVSAPALTSEVRRTADRLCCMLKNCVQATKLAADKYPLVSAVQSMVDSIVTVSHAAHDLKLLVKQCC